MLKLTINQTIGDVGIPGLSPVPAIFILVLDAAATVVTIPPLLRLNYNAKQWHRLLRTSLRGFTMNISPWIVIPASLLMLSAVSADSTKQILRNIDGSSLVSLELDISVGELDIEIYDGDEIQLEIDIEAQRRWFLFRNRNVDHVELQVRDDGSNLYLGIDERNIEQHWRVKLPAKLALEIDMGVGDIHIRDFANNLEMDVGVGSVRVELADIDYELIHLSVGVGEASIRGFANGTDNERNFISADSYYHGEGDLRMNIEVGVGEVDVRKN